MPTEAELEAAKKRWVSDDYPIANREHLRGIDAQTLADAYCKQQSQPVNERLLHAANSLLSTSVVRQLTGAGDAIGDLRKAIASAEAEIEERRKPVTREWLQSIGSKRVPDDVYPQSEANDNEQIGRMILWEFNDTGVWHMRDADWFDIKTRGDVLDLLRVLGGVK